MKKKLLIVKKFGGSSLSNIEKIKKAAKLVKKEIVLGEKSSALQAAWEKQVLKKILSFFFLLSQKFPLQLKVTIII